MANERIHASIDLTVEVKTGERSKREVAARVEELERDLRRRLKGMEQVYEVQMEVRAVDVIEPSSSFT